MKDYMTYGIYQTAEEYECYQFWKDCGRTVVLREELPPSYRKYTVRLPPTPQADGTIVLNEPVTITSKNPCTLYKIMANEQYRLELDHPTGSEFKEENHNLWSQTVPAMLPTALQYGVAPEVIAKVNFPSAASTSTSATNAVTTSTSTNLRGGEDVVADDTPVVDIKGKGKALEDIAEEEYAEEYYDEDEYYGYEYAGSSGSADHGDYEEYCSSSEYDGEDGYRRGFGPEDAASVYDEEVVDTEHVVSSISVSAVGEHVAGEVVDSTPAGDEYVVVSPDVIHGGDVDVSSTPGGDEYVSLSAAVNRGGEAVISSAPGVEPVSSSAVANQVGEATLPSTQTKVEQASPTSNSPDKVINTVLLSTQVEQNTLGSANQVVKAGVANENTDEVATSSSKEAVVATHPYAGVGSIEQPSPITNHQVEVVIPNNGLENVVASPSAASPKQSDNTLPHTQQVEIAATASPKTVTPKLPLASSIKIPLSLDVRNQTWPFTSAAEMDIDDGRLWTIYHIEWIPGGIGLFYDRYPGGYEAFQKAVAATNKGLFTAPELKALIEPALSPSQRGAVDPQGQSASSNPQVESANITAPSTNGASTTVDELARAIRAPTPELKAIPPHMRHLYTDDGQLKSDVLKENTSPPSTSPNDGKEAQTITIISSDGDLSSKTTPTKVDENARAIRAPTPELKAIPPHMRHLYTDDGKLKEVTTTKVIKSATPSPPKLVWKVQVSPTLSANADRVTTSSKTLEKTQGSPVASNNGDPSSDTIKTAEQGNVSPAASTKVDTPIAPTKDVEKSSSSPTTSVKSAVSSPSSPTKMIEKSQGSPIAFAVGGATTLLTPEKTTEKGQGSPVASSATSSQSGKSAKVEGNAGPSPSAHALSTQPLGDITNRPKGPTNTTCTRPQTDATVANRMIVAGTNNTKKSNENINKPSVDEKMVEYKEKIAREGGNPENYYDAQRKEEEVRRANRTSSPGEWVKNAEEIVETVEMKEETVTPSNKQRGRAPSPWSSPKAMEKTLTANTLRLLDEQRQLIHMMKEGENYKGEIKMQESLIEFLENELDKECDARGIRQRSRSRGSRGRSSAPVLDPLAPAFAPL